MQTQLGVKYAAERSLSSANLGQVVVGSFSRNVARHDDSAISETSAGRIYGGTQSPLGAFLELNVCSYEDDEPKRLSASERTR